MATQVQRRRGTAQDYIDSQFIGAEGEFTYDETAKTIRVHDGVTEGGFKLVKQNAAITPGTKTKITYDAQGLVTAGDNISASDISDLDTYLANNAVLKNTAIIGATKCKITYDAKGLVTAGENLSDSDIPTLATSKIEGLDEALASKMSQIPVKTPTTSSGSVQLIDNAINTVVATGAISFATPSVTDNRIIHQMVVQLQKPTAAWNVSLGTSVYFGSSSAPDFTTSGDWNIYYEYDANHRVWVVGAIKKIGF